MCKSFSNSGFVAQSRGIPVAESLTKLPMGSETVLVAEDETLIREFLVSSLTELGYRVFEAANGEEALSLSQNELRGKIDLLLTDIVMPKIGGTELATRMQEAEPAIKVIFCSGYPEKLAPRTGVVDP